MIMVILRVSSLYYCANKIHMNNLTLSAEMFDKKFCALMQILQNLCEIHFIDKD